MDLYESPITNPETKSVSDKRNFGRILKDYFSFSGSFSRAELAIATAVVAILFVLSPIFVWLLPTNISLWGFLILKALLYTIWGTALGKRSRDLGTTFTYGMVVGMLFPIIGIVFLFQKGAKHKNVE